MARVSFGNGRRDGYDRFKRGFATRLGDSRPQVLTKPHCNASLARRTVGDAVGEGACSL